MSIDKNTVREKLEKLSHSVKLLEKYRGLSREDFLIDFTVNSAAQYNLILGIEIIIDIGNHILSEIFEVHPKEYKEVIECLGKYEIVPKEFSQENIDMTKFRNLIVHQYGEVDMKEVYQHLQKAPDIFRQFAKYYLEFLK
ncbi:MAG: HepT-like ribonuclease domain-containing protein [Patescibacteria group bacterium]